MEIAQFTQAGLHCLDGGAALHAVSERFIVSLRSVFLNIGAEEHALHLCRGGAAVAGHAPILEEGFDRRGRHGPVAAGRIHIQIAQFLKALLHAANVFAVMHAVLELGVGRGFGFFGGPAAGNAPWPGEGCTRH